MTPPSSDRTHSRRRVLTAIGLAATGLAGCSGDNDPATVTESPMTTAMESPTATPTPTPTATATQSPTETATGTPTETATATPDGVPTTGPAAAGVEAFDAAIPDFLDQWDLPGAMVSVMHEGRLVFTRGYGYAGPDTEDPVQPDALCRVGSLSKPLTSLAVMTLVEDGDLSLDDAAVDVLSDLLPEGGPADDRAADVTVRHLLQHRSGWNGNLIGFDPVFAPVAVAEAMDADPPATAETTTEFLFTQPLGSAPGESYQYLNAGYCVLGRIVEEAAGTDYESYVTENVLDPLDATRAHVGATREANLHEDEVRYLSHGTVDSPFPDVDGEVPRPYGRGVLDEALDANGGWVASTMDLLRFVRGIDGRDDVPDLVGEDARGTMLERPDIGQWDGTAQYYGMGWLVIEGEDGRMLWHNGSLPGSYGFLAQYEGRDLAVAALFNGRSPGAQFTQFNAAAVQTVRRATESVAEWPDRGLFGEYE